MDESENLITGIFEVYLGKNIGYCFIDDIGTNFELLFIRTKEKIDDFLKKKFVIKNPKYEKEKLKIIPNKLDTNDRANILLINFPDNNYIKINKKTINLYKIYCACGNFFKGNSLFS